MRSPPGRYCAAITRWNRPSMGSRGSAIMDRMAWIVAGGPSWPLLTIVNKASPAAQRVATQNVQLDPCSADVLRADLRRHLRRPLDLCPQAATTAIASTIAVVSGLRVARPGCRRIGGRFWQMRLAVKALANTVIYYCYLWITTDTVRPAHESPQSRSS